MRIIMTYDAHERPVNRSFRLILSCIKVLKEYFRNFLTNLKRFRCVYQQ
ncbi:Uncharacterised protein [Vibrio cholerae]|nr:Uncharacterised protein [Vibrio cholerae]